MGPSLSACPLGALEPREPHDGRSKKAMKTQSVRLEMTKPAEAAGFVVTEVADRSAHPGGLGGLMDTGVRAFLRPTTFIRLLPIAARASGKFG